MSCIVKTLIAGALFLGTVNKLQWVVIFYWVFSFDRWQRQLQSAMLEKKGFVTGRWRHSSTPIFNIFPLLWFLSEEDQFANKATKQETLSSRDQLKKKKKTLYLMVFVHSLCFPQPNKNVAGWRSTFPHWPQGGTKALTGCVDTGTDYRPTALCCQLLSIICPWTVALLSSSVCAHCTPYCAAHKLNVSKSSSFLQLRFHSVSKKTHGLCRHWWCMLTLIATHFGYLYIWLMHISADRLSGTVSRDLFPHIDITFANDYISGSYWSAHMAAKKGHPSSSKICKLSLPVKSVVCEICTLNSNCICFSIMRMLMNL